MLNGFIDALKTAVGWFSPEWLLLGALIAATAILAVGFLMTIHTAKILSSESSKLHSMRSHARRNVLFIIAFAFVIASTAAVIYRNPIGMPLYLTIPASVAFWAFLCEAMFEIIDDRNRSKNKLELCGCEKAADTAGQKIKNHTEVVIREALHRAEKFDRERIKAERLREEIKEKKPTPKPATPAPAPVPKPEVTAVPPEPKPEIEVKEVSGKPADSKFSSLKAKLDALKQDNAAAREVTNKTTDATGKYDESEVRAALASLIKSMNARRKDE